MVDDDCNKIFGTSSIACNLKTKTQSVCQFNTRVSLMQNPSRLIAYLVNDIFDHNKGLCVNERGKGKPDRQRNWLRSKARW